MTSSNEWKKHKTAVIVAFFVAFFVLFSLMSSNAQQSADDAATAKRVSAAGISAAKNRKVDIINKENNDAAANSLDGAWPALQPLWGYATTRNVARWNILSREINKIEFLQDSQSDAWFIDYGADQGYFTVNLAKHFHNHNAHVLAVEKGGTGGSFWLQKGAVDVYSIIDQKAQQYKVGNYVQLCPIEVNTSIFQQLKDENCIADGQMLLSMLHWVKIDGRQAFNSAIKLIASLAKTTLFELPSPYAKTCIYDFRYHGWYDGRKNLTDILGEALEGTPATFVEAGRTPWTTMTRSIYRIDSNEPFTAERRPLSDPVCQRILACRAAPGDV